MPMPVMRGCQAKPGSFVSLIDVEKLIATDHPIRAIKRMCDEALGAMSAHFDEIYAANGAPSIPRRRCSKEKFSKPCTQCVPTGSYARGCKPICSSGFVDLPMDEAPFDASSYSKNQSRLLQYEAAHLFLAEVMNFARRHGWVSDDHFSVDVTLIESWASLKSFKPKGDRSGPGSGNT